MHAEPTMQDYDIHLPVEIWLDVFSHTDTITIRSVTQTCSALRWIAQPLLFKLFVISLHQPPLSVQTTRRDARLGVLGSPHLAHAIEELRIHPTATAQSISSPSLSLDEDHLSRPANDLITTIFTSLINLKRLICHNIVFTSSRLQALTNLPQLTHLELHSCSTTCPPTSFPNFSTIPLERLTFDYPHSSMGFFHNPPFLFLFLQPPTLKHVSTGPTSDVILALTSIPALPSLTTLEIPVNTLSSPLFLPALAFHPSITKLSLHTPPHNCLPQLDFDFLPPTILPLLSTYRGPHIYAPVFTHDRTLSRIDFTHSCQPDDLLSTLLTLTPDPSHRHIHTHTFSCKLQHLTTPLFQTIHKTFPSLSHLAFSGAAVDIHALSSILGSFDIPGEEGKESLRSIQICVQMDIPRPTLRWRTIAAGSFLDLLLEVYPNLQKMRLVCHPEEAVVWHRPLMESRGRMGGGLDVFAAEQFWVEKLLEEERGGGGFWEVVKRKW